MPYPATVVEALIASPGDVKEERKIARDVILKWNQINGKKEGLIILPRMWEIDATPEMGGDPQEIINKQLVKDSDLIIAIFWTRLGTPTTRADSGTVEEIEQHIAAEKPALIYFSRKSPGYDMPFDQRTKLKNFEKLIKSKGLLGEFSDNAEFRERLRDNLEQTVHRILDEVREREKAERHLNDKVSDHPYSSRQRTNPGLAIEKALSSEALSFLSMAFSDPTGRLIRLEDHEGGLQVGTVQRTAYFSEPRDVAKAEAAIKELENIRYVEAEGYKRNSFKITKAGFDYLDDMVKNLSADDESQFDTLLEVAKTDPRTAIKRSWEALARIAFRCLGSESTNLDPNSLDCRDMIEHLRKSGRFPERLVGEIESLLADSRGYFTQSDFAGAPPKEDAIQFVFLSAAAGRDLLSVLKKP